MQKLISIDFQADFGFFRKPDVNATINLSYNMLHKPALLGILGAIIGLEGYKEAQKFPEYYQKLKDIEIGIEPLNHEKGNFTKTLIKYSNTIGYANARENFLAEEATLIKPAYRVYILLNLENSENAKLYEYLKECKAEYLPYFGKNEFYAWWEKESFQEYEFEKAENISENFQVKTLIIKSQSLQNQKAEVIFDIFNYESYTENYIYFERLPTEFDEQLHQYKLSDFAFTTFNLKPDTKLSNLYFLKSKGYYVQLH
ncbi:MAG: type I-B CRISPR-associated protein Cas5b [Raineya sp.]|nr:type I-B CRISPR-associated protein Cas5b [Bacteroidia bacterium]MDW8296816.1 type I-B CRISPR-associated protein Cas5b [Raineya sp.]